MVLWVYTVIYLYSRTTVLKQAVYSYFIRDLNDRYSFFILFLRSKNSCAVEYFLLFWRNHHAEVLRGISRVDAKHNYIFFALHVTF